MAGLCVFLALESFVLYGSKMSWVKGEKSVYGCNKADYIIQLDGLDTDQQNREWSEERVTISDETQKQGAMAFLITWHGYGVPAVLTNAHLVTWQGKVDVHATS